MLPMRCARGVEAMSHVLIRGVDGGLAGAIAMEAWKNRDRVTIVKPFNSVVQVINFADLISVVVRLGTIVPEPTELWRIHSLG